MPNKMICTAIGVRDDVCREYKEEISGNLLEVTEKWVRTLTSGPMAEGFLITEFAVKDVGTMMAVFAKQGIRTVPVPVSKLTNKDIEDGSKIHQAMADKLLNMDWADKKDN